MLHGGDRIGRSVLTDNDRLRIAVQHISLLRPDLSGNHCRTGREAGENDLAVFVRRMLTVRGADGIAIAVRHEEGHAGQRLSRTVHVLADDNCLLRNIAESDRLCVIGIHLDRLLLIGQHIALRRLDFLDDIGVRLQIQQTDLAVFIRDIDPLCAGPTFVVIHIPAVDVRDKELCAGQRLAVHAVHLADDQAAEAFVVECELLRFLLFYEDVL